MTFDGYAPSEKARYDEEVFEEDDDYVYRDSPGVRRSYYDGGLSRQSTMVRPEIAVPEYTVDLRRIRAIKASE
jgi:hypothetical protein